jgi:hypothetical protein
MRIHATGFPNRGRVLRANTLAEDGPGRQNHGASMPLLPEPTTPPGEFITQTRIVRDTIPESHET